MNGEQFQVETVVTIGNLYPEKGEHKQIQIGSSAAGAAHGVIVVELGGNMVAIKGEKLVLAIQAALGKSFIGTTWKENLCQNQK